MDERYLETADALATAEREAGVKRAARFTPEAEATGVCQNPACGEELQWSGARWCNAACRDEWQRYQDAKRRAGQ